jgi:hypothetical protein
MKFRVVHLPTPNHARSAFGIVETTGREVDRVNRYLDYECLGRVADLTLRSYAQHLLHFLRWWESVHHTDVIVPETLTESTLLDYVRFPSAQQPPFTGSIINQRVAVADRALRATFPGAPRQIAPEFQVNYWRRAPMGLGRPMPAVSRLRVTHRAVRQGLHQGQGAGHGEPASGSHWILTAEVFGSSFSGRRTLPVDLVFAQAKKELVSARPRLRRRQVGDIRPRDHSKERA